MRFRQFVAAVVLGAQAFAAWAGTPARAHCDEAAASAAAVGDSRPAGSGLAAQSTDGHPCGAHAAAPMAPAAPDTTGGDGADSAGAGCPLECCCAVFALPQGAAAAGFSAGAGPALRGAHRVPATVIARELRPPIA